MDLRKIVYLNNIWLLIIHIFTMHNIMHNYGHNNNMHNGHNNVHNRHNNKYA